MKPRTQIAVSLLTLAGLLGSAVSSYATDIAKLPLKASVLAKPNVIFGIDESTSMDYEVMLDTNDGAFWWDYTPLVKSGWDGSGKPFFNASGNADAQWHKLPYLFPNGTGTGARMEVDGEFSHFAIPPTSQFAFLRSSSYNTIYYNPAVTYTPWSKYYSSAGTVVTPGQASITAAKSHPVIGTTTMNLSADVPLNQTKNFTFIALPGMIIPAGSQTCELSVVPFSYGICVGSWTPEATQRTLPSAAKIRRLAMAYYPATYYKKEACTLLPDVCVAAPDGSTLKRYEIKPGNYASTTAYDAEMKNFANWWQYYRKRRLMLSGAMGKVLEPLTGLRLGFVTFHNPTAPTMYDTDVDANDLNGMKLTGLIYEANNLLGLTPTRPTLNYIGNQYITRTTDTQPDLTKNTNIIQYACQRNNAFIVTDGFATASTVTPPTYTLAARDAGAPYQTIFPGTLADIALSYYTNNLRAPSAAMPAGKVPIDAVDTNRDLHMNTYAMALGAKGTIFVNDSTPVPTLPGAWPNPNFDRSPTSVDDLWHATINGRGKMYLATTPEETAQKFQAGINDILGQNGAQVGVAVSTVNLVRGDSKAYFGKYNQAGWGGDLTANTIDPVSATITSTPSWSAATLLAARSWTTRIIATATSAGAGPAVDFTAANVGATVNPALKYGSNAAVIDYLRGDRSGESTAFRARTSLMGAVINSDPAVSREDSVAYVASGEGMLHAFDTSAATPGKELWAFVPLPVLDTIGATVERGYVFNTKLDGTPVLGKFSSTGKLLVAGMGAAGRGYYALDVTNPRVSAASQLPVKWHFPSALDTKVGQTLGRPVIVKTQSNGYVVLVTSGYNSTFDGKGRLWMLNADTGAIIKTFTTADGSVGAGDAGLAHVAGFAESNGTVQYVYGGDLLGNVWRFDLNDVSSPTNPAKLAILKDSSNFAQPVTSAPELLMNAGVRTVMIGTGRLMDITDFGSTRVQSIYAIADGAHLATPRSTLVQQTYNRGTDTMSNNSVTWATQRGWFIDLPAGEQINTRPTIAYGGLAFVSNSNGGTDCAASSWLYVVNALTGTKFTGTTFVGTQLSALSNSSGVTALLTTDQKIIGAGQDAEGNSWRRDIKSATTINPAKNSWIEIRR